MIINSSPETLERIKSIINDIEVVKIKLLTTLTELNMYNHINQDNLPEAIIEISKMIDEVIKFPDIDSKKLKSYETLLKAVSSVLKTYGNKIIQEKSND